MRPPRSPSSSAAVRKWPALLCGRALLGSRAQTSRGETSWRRRRSTPEREMNGGVARHRGRPRAPAQSARRSPVHHREGGSSSACASGPPVRTHARPLRRRARVPVRAAACPRRATVSPSPFPSAALRVARALAAPWWGHHAGPVRTRKQSCSLEPDVASVAASLCRASILPAR